MSRATEIMHRLPENQQIILGAEIGVRYGKNAAALLAGVPNLHMFLVDRWEKPPIGDSYYRSGDGIADRPQGHHDKTYRSTINLTMPYSERVTILKLESSEAARILRAQGIKLDFVFLDADHSYEGVKRDIELWLPFVERGGFISGHDYGHPRIGEVKRAVDEVFGTSVKLGSDMTWFVTIL